MIEAPSPNAFWQEDPFHFIKPEEYDELGIDQEDIPPGTLPARKHPSHLRSRFGGNAYGFGLFELYDRLNPEKIGLLQSLDTDNVEQIKTHYKSINRIYQNIGLLKRYSRLGKSYYLIPLHLAFSSLSRMKSKVNEISKIIGFHRKKYLQETHRIGLVTHAEDFLVNDLSLRFKEHLFIILDSFEKMRTLTETLDLVILSRDIYQILLMENFIPPADVKPSKKHLEEYVFYLFGKIYNLLKPDGEIFIIADHYTLRTNENIKITFKTEQEENHFILFSHIYKTQKKYQAKGQTLQINRFDFQTYLNPPYVEKEVLDQLLGQSPVEQMNRKDLNELPHLMFPVGDDLAYDQKKTWPKALSVFFNQLFLKPLLPPSIREDWEKRFSAGSYQPDYMLIYLGQKKPLPLALNDLKKEGLESSLSGCPLPLLADYRDSFDYLNRTLEVLKKMKSGSYTGLSEFYMGRLKEPLQNKIRRYPAVNVILRLIGKMHRLENIRSYLNPGMIEGERTPILGNLALLSLFDFSHEELKEILLIVVGHTAMDRILSGKVNEKSLKPLSDLARSLDLHQALNLLRYCRLMSMAETMASKKTDLTQEELMELFDLHEAMVKIITTQGMDWDQFLDEKLNAPDKIYRHLIRKILKMKNYFQFLDHWSELEQKGAMEKEALADYSEAKLAQIEDILNLLRISSQFERQYFKENPLQSSTFYRKCLQLEFYGTGQLFEALPAHLVFLQIWITVNVVQDDILNFNPVLTDLTPPEIETRVEKIKTEMDALNIKHLDLATLKQLSEQIDQNRSAFILGSGFQLKVNPQTQALDIGYIDLDHDMIELEKLTAQSFNKGMAVVPLEDLTAMGSLFAHLEDFYQSHLDLIARPDLKLEWPSRQKNWFQKIKTLREHLKSKLLKVIFKPQNIYDDLDRLYHYSRPLLHFIFPEFMDLQNIRFPEKGYIKSTLIDHILLSTKKLQCLIKKDREGFHDVRFLHKLAQREFGPAAAGIVGINESQIDTLESLVEHLGHNQPLFDALLKSFILRDIGLVEKFIKYYHGRIHPADHAHAGVYILQQERIPLRYEMDPKAREYLFTLVKHHNLIYHMIRGEYSFYAIQEVIASHDKDLFDAFFISSFIMFYAFGDEQILEDLAFRLFRLRDLCHKIIEGQTDAERHLSEIYARNGQALRAYIAFQQTGLPEGVTLPQYFDLYLSKYPQIENDIPEGKLIYAIERLFRLRGIRYVEFIDLLNYLIKVPVKFAYQKRHYYDIGFATYEKELYEAQRIYKNLQLLPVPICHFILKQLVTDDIRLFGFENVSTYLNYENMLKLLLLTLMGAETLPLQAGPVGLNFSSLFETIDKHYEAVNDFMSKIEIESLWENKTDIDPFFCAKTGILLEKDESHRVISVHFIDKVDMAQKVAYLKTIADTEQLINYYQVNLRGLQAIPAFTDDYEQALTNAFMDRFREITDQMLHQIQKQITSIQEFDELHRCVSDFKNRFHESGLTEEQKHRLNDIYELKKEDLKRIKLESIEQFLAAIQDHAALLEYWNSLKWYLQRNRLYIGKEFESLIAKKFDEKAAKIRSANA